MLYVKSEYVCDELQDVSLFYVSHDIIHKITKEEQKQKVQLIKIEAPNDDVRDRRGTIVIVAKIYRYIGTCKNFYYYLRRCGAGRFVARKLIVKQTPLNNFFFSACLT